MKAATKVNRIRTTSAIWVAAILIVLNSTNVEGRFHCHKKKSSSLAPPLELEFPPPLPAPATLDPLAPTVPSHPYPRPGSAASGCVFNVTSSGAVDDSSTDDTCCLQGCVEGPCKPRMVFKVDAVLTAPNGTDCWPEEDSKRQWLVFCCLNRMTPTGKGTVDGNGEPWWDLHCKPHRGPGGKTLPGPCDSPTMIRFFMSSNLVASNSRIQNSPQFHVKFDGCGGVFIRRLSISSPKLSPNTDGIHIENTKPVAIHDSVIANGDDCISIGQGCSDVDINAVTCGPSHGIGLGVHNFQACVSIITVRDAVIRESDDGLRIVMTWQGRMGSVAR